MAKDKVENVEELEEEIEDRGDLYDPEDEDEELEEEVDDEEDDDEEDDEEDENDETPEPKIPKSRLDEVIAQREEAKERTLWLEAQLETLIKQAQSSTQVKDQVVEKPYDFSKAEEDYVSLIIEGEVAKASKLRSEIDSQREKQFKKMIEDVKESSSKQVKESSVQAIEEQKFQLAIESLEAKYKFLDTNSKDYNEEAVDTVNTLLAGYIAAGKSKSEGLRLAVNKVVPMYAKDEKDTKPSLGNKRKVDSGKKAVQAAKSQPPKTKSTNTRSSDVSTLDIRKMSDKDFSKLTETELKQLRGDF